MRAMCEERRHHDHDAHVGGKGVAQGHVFQKVVEEDAEKARQSKVLFLPQGHAQGAPCNEPQGKVAQDKAREENLDGLHVLEKNLGSDEGCSPEEDGEKGSAVAPDGCGA